MIHVLCDKTALTPAQNEIGNGKPKIPCCVCMFFDHIKSMLPINFFQAIQLKPIRVPYFWLKLFSITLYDNCVINM